MYGAAAKEQISSYCAQRRIQFHFIPPRAPHMGGLWEAAVKSFKTLLCRTVASTALTYEEMSTVAAEIEAVLNSRPLTRLSSDPNDLNSLTPGHFLIGEPITATVDPQSSDQNMTLLSRWQLVSYCRAEFWKRWSVEYISGLQQRAKWAKEYPNMVTGTLVLIKEDNLPPLQWSMGRVTELMYGPDGRVRVAHVRTATGVIRRAIQYLAPLPIEVEETNPDELTKETVQLISQPLQTGKRKADIPIENKKGPKFQTGSFLPTMLLIVLIMLPLAAM